MNIIFRQEIVNSIMFSKLARAYGLKVFSVFFFSNTYFESTCYHFTTLSFQDKKVAMARDLFFHSEKHFLLYSERAHFYRRYALKGIRHLIFYQLPQSPGFFSELCNLMQPAFQNRKGGSQGNMSCTVLYCKYDVHRLASVVTSNRAELMLQNSQKHIHMFAQKQT